MAKRAGYEAARAFPQSACPFHPQINRPTPPKIPETSISGCHLQIDGIALVWTERFNPANSQKFGLRRYNCPSNLPEFASADSSPTPPSTLQPLFRVAHRGRSNHLEECYPPNSL